jgi:hypothetical protein
VYHYVVTGEIDDDGNVQFYIDDDTAVGVFKNGVVYDSLENSWHPVNDETEDREIARALYTGLGLEVPSHWDLTTEPRFG